MLFRSPFCKIIHHQAVALNIIILIESDELHLEMQYEANATSQLLADLETYRDNYSQLYGDLIKLHYEGEETGNSFFVRLSLPLVEKPIA